jgi:hypothetical protein
VVQERHLLGCQLRLQQLLELDKTAEAQFIFLAAAAAEWEMMVLQPVPADWAAAEMEQKLKRRVELQELHSPVVAADLQVLMTLT